MKKIFSIIGRFLKNHPIIAHLIYITITGFIVMWITLIWLEHWTGHGDFREVPDIKGLSYNEAAIVLAASDLQAVLSDSVFNTKVTPGQVVEQIPKAGSKVKPERAVYVIINAYSPRTVTVPNMTDISLRQARSIIEGLGIKNIRVVEVPSEYKGLVMAVKYNGLPLSSGMRIPITAAITIEVGKGIEQGDSTIIETTNEEVESGDDLGLF